MEEEAILNYYDQYHQGQLKVILPVWDGVKGATKLTRLYDHTGCLTRDDLSQVGLIAVDKSFKTYKNKYNTKLRTWTITLCNQAMIRELKKHNTKSFPFSKIVNSEDLMDNILYQVSLNFEPSYIFEEFYQKIIKKTSKILYNKNRKINELFLFKLNNPDLDKSAIMNKLRISTVYYSYMNQITEVVKKVINEL